MRKYFLLAGSLLMALFMLTSCFSSKKLFNVENVEVPLILDVYSVQQRYTELDYGLRFNVNTTIPNSQIIDMSELPSKTVKSLPTYTVTPQLKQFVSETIGQYARRLGIPVNTSLENDYTLNVNVKVFKLRMTMGASTVTVTLEYSLEDSNHNLVIAPTTSSGRIVLDEKNVFTNIFNNTAFTKGFNKAYMQALDNFDWDRIASYLKIHKSAKQEKQRSVEGEGNTALEHTVIRWFIISSPQGADVSWRVISSTPDVKNTNSVYLGTTPYETTESFDIRGLSYQNSGNVQIEVTCEKPGYLPQKRRFNVRQAIDQKEVSAKFNLIKDE